jgi:hypothetical protein
VESVEAVLRTDLQLFIPARDGLKELDLGIPTYGEDKALDEDVYDKLRLEGEILERIVPLVIKERFLRGHDYVLTEQLAQAGLRTPGETRVVSPEAWEQGIAAGVHKGLFGLGGLEDDKPVCYYFKEQPSVGLAGSEVIIRSEVCQAQQIARQTEAEQLTYPPSEAADTPLGEAGPSAISKPHETTTQVAGHMSLHMRRQVRLRFAVPKGKVSGLMGVMNLLQHKFDRLDIALSAHGGEISEQEYEDKIQEAFRQLGIEVVDE